MLLSRSPSMSRTLPSCLHKRILGLYGNAVRVEHASSIHTSNTTYLWGNSLLLIKKLCIGGRGNGSKVCLRITVAERFCDPALLVSLPFAFVCRELGECFLNIINFHLICRSPEKLLTRSTIHQELSSLRNEVILPQSTHIGASSDRVEATNHCIADTCIPEVVAAAILDLFSMVCAECLETKQSGLVQAS